ncbi:MAG TPA: type II toxin-antitoxin system HipA family toxin [Cytophagaceae bacterium]|jgi:serine/threonine-protein kinase HipA|nr:type II toxin-antitoxin system HipA family toxin [Cytophagaceae bacterium]
MTAIKKIIVSIHLGGQEIELGELLSEGKRIYFKYYSSFIDRGIEISPFKLKLSDQLHYAKEIPFDGLFGVFADSLPDGWGRLLLDRTLTSRGISIQEITPLDRLSYVGTKGMGALIYRPEMDSDFSESKKIELDSIAQATNHILKGTSSDVLEELFQLGGSSGGARPKILVGYNSTLDQLTHGEEDLPKDYEHWLIKFSASSDRKDSANIEYAYYKMAIDAGIEMNESKLFKSDSGNVYFGTKRFDRVNNKRLHLHSAAGLMHDNFRLSNIDYGDLMDGSFKLENHVRAYENILRMAAFNVFAHNRDDHSKNFSFLMDEIGKWKLAPAYDLTFSTSTHGMHSTMVSGESQNPSKKHLMELVDYFKINKGLEIIQKVQDVTSSWKFYAAQSGVEKESESIIGKTMLRVAKK